MRKNRLTAVLLSAAILAGCSDEPATHVDASVDTGSDTGAIDGGNLDIGRPDSGDSGTIDSAVDKGTADSAVDKDTADSGDSGTIDSAEDKGTADSGDSGTIDSAVDTGSDGPAAAISPFADTFKAKANLSTNCTKVVDMLGSEPTSAAETYPLFIWTPGTGGVADAVTAVALTEAMAARGFVAAAVNYNTLANILNLDCAKIGAKAACVFDPTKPESAVTKLCARPKADCDKGIVVAGLSQGSFMAMLARDHEPRVRAAYVLGAGNDQSTAAFADMSGCLDAGSRALPADRLRAVNGESDGNWPPQQQQLEAITGITCAAGATQCLRANGSGYLVVQDSEVADGVADHCYQALNGCGNVKPLDPAWLAGTAPWAMSANLAWLASFAN